MKRFPWFLAAACTLLLVFGSIGGASAESLVDNAEIINIKVPLCMETGKIYEAEVTVKNPGPSTWDNSFRLGSQDPRDNGIWGLGRVFLPTGVTVTPGETYPFKFRITAPSDPGNYSFSWQIVHEGVRWVGEKKGVTIEVVRKNDAEIVAIALVIPENGDYPHTNEKFQAKVTVKNKGITTWRKDALYRLGSLHDDLTWGIQSLRSYLADEVCVAPGESYDFFVELFAPAQTGTFILGVRMLEEKKQWFGESREVEIKVYDPPNYTLFNPNPKVSPDDFYTIKEGSWEDSLLEGETVVVSFFDATTGLVKVKFYGRMGNIMKTFHYDYLDIPGYIPGTAPFAENSPPRKFWGYHFSNGFSRPGGYYVYFVTYDEDQGRDLIFVDNVETHWELHQLKFLRDPETGEAFGFWDRHYVETGIRIFWPEQISLAINELFWPEIGILIGNYLFVFTVDGDRLTNGHYCWVDGYPHLAEDGTLLSSEWRSDEGKMLVQAANIFTGEEVSVERIPFFPDWNYVND